MSRRLILALAVVTALALGGAFGLQSWTASRTDISSASGVGGPFNLVDTDGRAVTERDLRGKPTLIYFGFTYCPEVCPTTLAAITQWLHELGPDADRMNVVFVSLDPERDTPAAMKTYLTNFDPHIRGFTGSLDEVAAIAKAYRVYYRKVPTPDGSYTIDHSTAAYLFDAKGRFIAPISYGEASATVVPRLREIIR